MVQQAGGETFTKASGLGVARDCKLEIVKVSIRFQ